MRLIRRRRSRRQRVKNQLKDFRKRAQSVSLPSRPDLPDLPELPSKPSLPELPELRVPKRVSRDSSGDTPFLSLTGGLLLGLLVGVIVAGILIGRRHDGDSASQRQTGIKLLLSNEEIGDADSSVRSAINTG
jgi:hypothetical protein